MSVGRIFGKYKAFLKSHTYTVQTVQTGFLLGVGDLLSQSLIEPPEIPTDYRRTLRFMFMGTLIGPTVHKWYTVLDKLIGTEKGFKIIIKKIALDQLIMAPVMLGSFITTITLLEGGGIHEIKKRLRKDYIDILRTNYRVWPAVQLITFSLPAHYRVLFVQTIAIGWNTYLAWRINHHKHKKVKKTSV